MPYKVKGKCIYKKKSDGSLGKKVGCTKGSVDKYLSALHANVNESQDFEWVNDIPSEVDFDTWDKIANIIDNELSQGPGYDFWVGSDSYETLKDILGNYNLDIDNMEDFFQFPPQDRFGNYFTTYKINELKDDLGQNGFDDPEDIFESTIKESEFNWVDDIGELPNYQGHPQGVVHLRSHAEITEFFDLIGGTYGIIGKRKNELEKTKSDFHNALDETILSFESEEWGGYDDWVPAISASFFISKQDPTKYDTGYWDYDVDEGSVEDWLVNQGCEEEIIDCENWKIYTDISQLRTLFNDYTGEVLHKTKSGKPIKVGDKVKVIDPASNQYGEVLEVEHLVGGDGYEKHGGAFQTVDYDTLYFAGHEVEHAQDLKEDFEWTNGVKPKVDKVEDMIHVGAVYKINPNRIIGGDLHMLLKVYDVGGDVHYEVITSNDEDETVGDKGYVRYREAVRLLKPRKTYEHNDDGSVTEKELEPYWIYQQHESEHITEDFDWLESINESNYLVNKAFYFNPPAEGGDKDYEKLTQLLESLGFNNVYGTPLKLVGNQESAGLYAYRSSIDGSLSYVYTEYLDEDEDYYMHIRGFAEGESEDRGKNLEVVDAREFVSELKTNINESNDFGWVDEVKPGIAFGKLRRDGFKDVKVGDKILLSGEFMHYSDGRNMGFNYMNIENEPFIITNINMSTHKLTIKSINQDFINNEKARKYFLNYNNETFLGEWCEDDNMVVTPMGNSINESNDFEWVDDVPRKHDLDDIRIGGKYYWGRNLLKVTNLEQKIKIVFDNGRKEMPYFRVEFTWLTGEYSRDGVDATSSDIFLELLDNGTIRPSTYKSLSESSDFGWVDNIKPGLTPGETYRVKNHNGTWTDKVYCGKGETDHPNTGEIIMGHRFRDLNSRSDKCNEWWSEESLQSKINDNLIEEYDPNWSILDDIEFGTLDDIKGRNFAIYFENGVDIEQTTNLQKTLFDMGYAFPNRKDEFKPVTNEDTNNKKIIFFECFNWDNTMSRYSSMPPNMRDEGTMLMVADNPDNYFRDDDELSRQYTLNTVIDHNAVVVNGYDYLDGTINEDFDWIREIGLPDVYVGAKFKTPNGNILTVFETDDFTTSYVVIDSNGRKHKQRITTKEFISMNKERGLWEKIDDETPINESQLDDFDWVQDIPAGDSHRYFDINVCYESFYDEETGEDECVEGGSYFVKIPIHVVPEIWDYEADDEYYAGPGDEGYGVIEWSIENNQINADDIDMFQYVAELPKQEYCRAWGNWQNEDKELCREYIVESNSLKENFDWVDSVSSNPLEWRPGYITLDNIERDEDGWPVHDGDGEGEIWVDVGGMSVEQKNDVLDNIKTHLGSIYMDNDKSWCSLNKIKGYLVHCGHEENNFFSQENHICCISDSYEDFISTEGDRPFVNGSIFLKKVNSLTEDFDWAKEDLPPFYTLEWNDHPLALAANDIWGGLDIGGEFTPRFNTFKDLKYTRKEYPNGNWISVVSGPNWIPSAFDDNPTDPEDINSDRLGDRFEVMSSEMEEPQIMTMDEVNQHMETLEV